MKHLCSVIQLVVDVAKNRTSKRVAESRRGVIEGTASQIEKKTNSAPRTQHVSDRDTDTDAGAGVCRAAYARIATASTSGVRALIDRYSRGSRAHASPGVQHVRVRAL